MAKKLEEIDTINEKPLQDKLVTELLAKADSSKIFGRDGLFEQLKKQIVERVLSSELEHELGYSSHSKAAKSDSNRRNGSFEKTIIDDNGRKITIDVPRDREGQFEPQLILI